MLKTTETTVGTAPVRHEETSPLESKTAAPPTFRQKARDFYRDNSKFAFIALEFYLLVLLVERFHLESQTFHRVFLLAWGGFVIHHFLPMKLKIPFFALLSLLATVAVVDSISTLSLTGPGVALVGLGLILLSICHLPIQFATRVAMLVVIGVGLSIIRANFQWFPALEGIWPVLASMFMFRIMIYMYDLKHHSVKFSLSRGVSYFFMLPNVCFPLFPIVDYKTFTTTYYNAAAADIYQTGIKWMLRGIIQLLLYRLVYQFGLLNISDVRDLGDVAEFMVATYLLYLRVSGQFHIIVGLLHMFGFNLPETHHLYLLASSFTDFWRRINIYWKDFIMKLFFYPAFFLLRNLSTVRAIAVGTAFAFFATWVLHSWQWFWFRGKWLVTWQDISFWTILALLVLVNAVIEAVRGRRRALTQPKFDSRARFILGLKTVGTFVVICTLWTLWSSQSADELWVLAESATHASWSNIAAILIGLTAIGIAGALWGSTNRENSLGQVIPSSRQQSTPFWRIALPTAAMAAGLLLITFRYFGDDHRYDTLLFALRHDQMNSADKDWQRRGYYEELDTVRGSQHFWGKVKSAPVGWTDNERLFRDRDDFIHREMIPGVVAQLSGAPATINRWGMRDRDYSKEKSPLTYRIALLGSSHEVGSGVRDNESFENIVEDRLNKLSTHDESLHYEILNFSVGGFSLYEKLYLLEQVGYDFNPDAIFFTVCAGDRRFILEHLADVVQQNRAIPYDDLVNLLRNANVDRQHSPLLIHHRLDSYVPEMYRWIFTRLKNECIKRGLRAFVVYRPTTDPIDQRDIVRRDELLACAREADLEIFDLSAAFSPVQDRSTLTLAEWDDHTNATGHKLLADELFNQLVPLLDNVGKSPTNTRE